MPGPCFAGSHSPWSPPFAPPAPLRSGPLCSPASQLLWQSLTSSDRASSATAHRLPDADRRQLPNGRSRDLPVPEQEASAHARVFDHAGSSERSQQRALTCCLPTFARRRHPGRTLSRLDGWPMHSPVNASPWPSRTTAHDSGPMWIATPSSQGTCTLYSLPVSRRFAIRVRCSPNSCRRGPEVSTAESDPKQALARSKYCTAAVSCCFEECYSSAKRLKRGPTP